MWCVVLPYLHCTHKCMSMPRTERIDFRISPELKQKVETIAKERGVSVSELLTDYIKRLPNPKD